MDLFELISASVNSLKVNKLRAGLTILGVIIGVGAVITMIAVGEGAKRQITDSIKSLGTNLLIIRRGYFGRGPSTVPPKDLTLTDVEAIKEKAKEYVEKVLPESNRSLLIEFENVNITTNVAGTLPIFTEVRNYEIVAGRNFSEEDLHAKKKVCILGHDIVENLFGEYNPLGEKILINRQSFEIIGVLKEKGTQIMGNPDEIIFVPLPTAQRRLFGQRDEVSTIYVKVISENLIDKAQEEITKILRESHNLKENEDDDFTIRSQKDMLSTMQATLGTFAILLASIATVSLIVGGIGIMNIMLVSVVERIREIGILKAVGATPLDIMLQFLIEAVILSLAGGVIGIVLGISLSKLIVYLAGWQTVITLKAILLAFLFSISVGIFFGFYPARKAAKLNPIDALRYE